MADSPEDLAKQIVTGTTSDTAAKVINSDVSKALLFPVAAETGQLLGEITSAVRFYATENLERSYRSGRGTEGNLFQTKSSAELCRCFRVRAWSRTKACKSVGLDYLILSPPDRTASCLRSLNV